MYPRKISIQERPAKHERVGKRGGGLMNQRNIPTKHARDPSASEGKESKV